MTASYPPMSRRIAYRRRVSLFHIVIALLGLVAMFLLLATPARSATVIGSIQDVTGRPYGGMVNQIQFTPLSCPQAIGTNTVWPVTKAARLTNGIFSVNLVGGIYYVGLVDGPMTFTPKTVKILVPPNDTNAYQLNYCANLATNLGTFTWTNYVGQLARVTTTNSPTVTFTGDGTPTNPLTATAAGGGQVISNALFVSGAIKFDQSGPEPFANGIFLPSASQTWTNLFGADISLSIGGFWMLNYGGFGLATGTGSSPTNAVWDNLVVVGYNVEEGQIQRLPKASASGEFAGTFSGDIIANNIRSSGAGYLNAGSGNQNSTGGVVIGSNAKVTYQNGVAIGYGAQTQQADDGTDAENAIAIGYNALAYGTHALALCENAWANGATSIAIGSSAAANSASIAIGDGSDTRLGEYGNIAIGSAAEAGGFVANLPTGNRNISIGYLSTVNGSFTNTVNIGSGSAVSNGWFHYRGKPVIEPGGRIPADRITNGLTTTIQFKISGQSTNTLYFTNGILMRVTQP